MLPIGYQTHLDYQVAINQAEVIEINIFLRTEGNARRVVRSARVHVAYFRFPKSDRKFPKTTPCKLFRAFSDGSAMLA